MKLLLPRDISLKLIPVINIILSTLIIFFTDATKVILWVWHFAHANAHLTHPAIPKRSKIICLIMRYRPRSYQIPSLPPTALHILQYS